MVATVHGEWHNAAGPRAGSYAVYLPVRLTDPAGNLIHPAGLYDSGPLVAGEFEVEVPGSDDPDISPQGWQLQIVVSFATGQTERYSIPVADGTTVELADVVLPQELGEPEPVLIRGVPGGIATLDEDGKVPEDQLPDAIVGLTAEDVRDTIGTAMVGSGLVTVTPNDLADTITVSTTATANSSDATLLARANHSGAQAISTVTGLQAALDGKEAADADLTAIAGLSPSNDDLIQRKSGAWANRTPAQVKTDLALTKSDVGLSSADNTSDASKPISTATQTALDGKAATGHNHDATYQPLDSDLTAVAALSPSNDDVVQRKAGAWTNRTPAQLKTDLALAKGDVGLGNVDNTSDANKPVSAATQTALDAKQALDSDLTTIAGLTATTDNFLQAKASAWASRTVAQVKTDLGLTGTNSGDQTSIVGITGTKAQFDTAVTDGNILYVGDVTQYTDELAQDAVGAMAADTATVDVTYADATPELKWDVKDDSITYAKLQNVSATDRFLGRDTAGAGDVEEVAPAAARAILNVADGATANDTDANLKNRANHTGTQAPTTITGLTADAAELNILDGATLTTAELNHVDGVTSAVQTQIDGKQPLDADLTTIAGLTATTDSFLQAKASAWAARTVAQVKADLGIVPVDVQVFTASGTWTKPSGVAQVHVVCVGGGGGGGSGRRGAAGTARVGGGGGGGGGLSSRSIPASACGATETVTVSAAVAGGAAVTANDTNGNNGTNGGVARFGAHVQGNAGNGAAGGQSGAGGTAGAGGSGAFAGSSGNAASTSGAQGGGAGAPGNAGAGGGSGGGVTTGDVVSAGGAGGAPQSVNRAAVAGGAAGTSGTAVTDAPADSAEPGLGGPGGGSSITGVAGSGAAGGLYGGAGGGGGASLNGNNSGAGGAGGGGIVLVISS